MSAVALLGIDNLCFGAEAITFGLAWPFVTAFAFLVTTFTVFVVQMWLHRDRFLMAAPKALLCGILAGFPTSIGGTVVAAFVLVWAGLAKFGRWIFKR